jgi:hypothetical protein
MSKKLTFFSVRIATNSIWKTETRQNSPQLSLIVLKTNLKGLIILGNGHEVEFHEIEIAIFHEIEITIMILKLV